MSIGFGFVISALAIILALYALTRWHSSTDTSRYAALLLERGMADVSAAEIDREMTLRMAAVEFRRKVSLAVIADPARYEELIIATAKSEALILAATDKPAAKVFLAWVEGAEFDELLHPLAAEAAWKAVRSAAGGQISPILSAALRVQ